MLGLARETPAPREGAAPRTALRIGGQLIRLRPAAAKQADWRTGRRPVAGSADLCFLVDVPAEEVVRQLGALRIPVETGPVSKQGAAGPIVSLYCRDPDGNLIEIASPVSAEAGELSAPVTHLRAAGTSDAFGTESSG